MNTTRREFVRTLFVAGQVGLFGGLLGSRALAETQPGGLRFLVFGDWGVEGATGQAQVAAQMARVAQESGAMFMQSVGDNFYQVGVTSVDDPQWQTSFEKVYAAKSLQIPCYAILGNHDYCGNCDAQIEYGKTHPRWIMPARYYTKTHAIDNTSSVQFFYIDTSPFVKAYYHGPNSSSPGGAGDKAPDAMLRMQQNVSGQDVEKQLLWLKEELAVSKADWKIVVGHHPVYSRGVNGDQPELVEKILPLLHQYGAQVYIGGHDHDLQHLQSGGIDFLCSGGGGAKLFPLHSTGGMKFGSETFGFMNVALNGSMMKVDFIDGTGKVIYQTAITRTVS